MSSTANRNRFRTTRTPFALLAACAVCALSTLAGCPRPLPPRANAGPNQTLTDWGRDGKEQVTLNGTASEDADGSISRHIWEEGGRTIATGVSAQVELSVGSHDITLTVQDDDGLTDSDTVLVTVNQSLQPDPIIFTSETRLIRDTGPIVTREVRDDSVIIAVQEGTDAPRVGDILLGTVGEGYLRRIVRVQMGSDGMVTVYTEQATLEEAITEATFSLSVPLEIVADKNTRRSQNGSGGVSFTDRIELSPLLHVEPRITIDPGVSLHMDYKIRLGLKYFHAYVKGELNADVLLLLELGGRLQVKRDYRLNPSPIPLGGFALGPVPVIASLDVYLGGEFDAAVGGTVEFGANLESTVKAGVQYDDAGWSPIAERSTQFQRHDLQWDLQGRFTAEAYLKARIGTRIAGVAGPFFDVRLPSLELAYGETTEERVVTLAPGMVFAVGGDVRIFWFTLAEISVDVFELRASPWEWRFHIVQNEPPFANGQSVMVAFNTAKAITLSATDPDNGPEALTYSIVSQPGHGTLTGSAPSATYTPNTGYNGPDSFTFKAYDGADWSNVATVSLTVQTAWSDDFEDAVIDPSLWEWEGRDDLSPPWGGWHFSHEEITATDGYLQIRVWGPTSGDSVGAEAWVQTKYDYNNGSNHIIDFRWATEVSHWHVDMYAIHITDGTIPAGSDMFWFGDRDDEKDGPTWRTLHFKYEEPDMAPVDWSIYIDAATQTATLFDEPNLTGQIIGQKTLPAGQPWYVRFIQQDGTSAGFPQGDNSLYVYSFTTVR